LVLLNSFLALWPTGVDFGAFRSGFATLRFRARYHNVLSFEPATLKQATCHPAELTAGPSDPLERSRNDSQQRVEDSCLVCQTLSIRSR